MLLSFLFVKRLVTYRISKDLRDNSVIEISRRTYPIIDVNVDDSKHELWLIQMKCCWNDREGLFVATGESNVDYVKMINSVS